MSKYEDILEWASRRSIFYPSAEIYSGPAGFWNFGPYGEAIRRKIVDFWRKELVQKEDMIEIYGCQTLPESVFKSSGHLKSFNDPLVQCKKCNTLHRADQIVSEVLNKRFPEATPIDMLNNLIKKHKIVCPKCKGELSEVTLFNMMLKTDLGAAKNRISCYLRPESCQSIFTDFSRMVKTMRVKLPKGIAQVGRVFRNEINPRQSLFREVEFSQIEIEVFFDPKKINAIAGFNDVKDYQVNILRIGKKEVEKVKSSDLVKKKIVSGELIAYYLARTQQLYEKYGIRDENLRFREVDKDERAFYAKETWDFEVNTAIGWVEVIANNYRTDYDLKGHMEGSKKDLRYTDEKGDKILPHIWEISGGVDRTFYCLIDNAFKKEKERTVLELNPRLSPYDVAVFPLMDKDKMPELAKKITKELREDFTVFYDEAGSIGKRYRRMDEIGVKAMITIDHESLKDQTVTLRDRDTMKQVRIKIKDLSKNLKTFLKGEKIEKLGKIVS